MHPLILPGMKQYWFATLSQVLRTLRQLREQHHIEVQSSDWVRLAHLPVDRQGPDVQGLFFPGLQEQHESDVSRLRVKDFFADLDDVAYDKAYEVVFSNPTMPFPNVHALLKTTSREGKVMRTIMSHVGQWLNREPFRVTDRASVKPPLRNDFIPTLRERYPDDADTQSIELQRRILTCVRERMAQFTHVTVEALLDIYPLNAVDTYKDRFEHDAWRELLILVYEFCGPHFQTDAMACFNLKQPSTADTPLMATVAQRMCQILPKLSEITRNPALQGAAATRALCRDLQPVILQWAIRQCKGMLAARGSSRTDPNLQVVQEQLLQYRQQVDSAPEGSTQENTLSGKTPVVQPPERPAEASKEIHTPPRSVSATALNSGRIKPRLVVSHAAQTTPGERTTHPPPSLPSTEPVEDHRPSKKRRLDIHRDLDDILGLPPNPSRLRLHRGWRTRLSTDGHKRSGASTWS